MLGDAVVVDLDKNRLHTEYNDVESLPNSIVADLKKKLKGMSVILQNLQCHVDHFDCSHDKYAWCLKMLV